MGICTKKNFLLSVCVFQLITTIERQIFDFLGYMWAPILANFFEIIFVILGFFGTFQFHLKYIFSYFIWNLIWIAWNSFIICFYLNIGVLNKESDVLNLGTGSVSWWEVNGYGCKPFYSANITDEDIYRPVRPERVVGCLLDYTYVEVMHATLQCVLAILGCISGTLIIEKHPLESDKKNKRPSLYSIEFSPRQNESEQAGHNAMRLSHSTSPKPMTPRKVKRRSVMVRGYPANSRRSSSHSHSSARSSRRLSQNPVTCLIEQQQQKLSDDSMYVNSNVRVSSLPQWNSNGHSNPMYQQSSMQSLNTQEDLNELYNNRPPSARSSYSNFHGTRPISGHCYTNLATPQVPQKRNSGNKQNVHNTMFLNMGPPAYSLGHLDSETTI